VIYKVAADEPKRMPPALPGFGSINRYWDPVNATFAAKLLPGEYYITQHDELITTVLGSCVAACIRDPATGIGGMNHFMLPASSFNEVNGGGMKEPDAARYGIHAMDLLIDDIVTHGGRRAQLEIKLCGGGKVVQAMVDVGAQNVRFVRKYLRDKTLGVAAADLGGIHARKVNYHPASGRVLVKALRELKNHTVLMRERIYQNSLTQSLSE
jgi:chemotaxis protein CheD